MLERLWAEFPGRPILLLWDGAAYHRSLEVCARAQALGIELLRLPAYSPDFLPVGALWQWLREDITYHRCPWTAQELLERVKASGRDAGIRGPRSGRRTAPPGRWLARHGERPFGL